MASGASARTLFAVVAGIIGLLAFASVPAGADDPGPDCASLVPTITGSNAAEWLVGTEGDDIIRAGAGDDTISSLGGNDVICAGPGNDTSRGGTGDDMIRSGRGNDSSSGEGGDDSMRGQGDTDYADGGSGVDECLFETHVQCEADLEPTITGPSAATSGGSGVSTYNVKLINHGPTPAVNSRVSIQLPSGAVFVPGVSDARCTLFTETEVRCVFGTMGLDVPNSGDIGLTFSGCTERSVDITGTAEDPRTVDHVPANDVSTKTTALTLDPVCSPVAVDDSATVPHDSAAKTIDVLANDKNNGATPLVGSTTNAAHGTVAITNGGANVSYTPAASYCGPDSFTYSLTPGGSTATVTVNVLCPTAVDDSFTANPCGPQQLQPIPGTSEQAFRLDVLPNDTNPAGAGPIKVASVTQPTVNGTPHGTATIIEGGAAIRLDRESGFSDFQQTYVFTYKLSPGGSQATVSVTIVCQEGETS
jgi:uncharacterized repeat protein (TIGR01451 family)